jgi:hypothetical protein
MDKLIIALILLVIVLYYFHVNKFDKFVEGFRNANSKKDSDYEQTDPENWETVGYRNLFDWNKSEAIPISKEANQIAYDINSDEPTGLAYNSRYPWIAPTLNPNEIPNSQMNLMN